MHSCSINKEILFLAQLTLSNHKISSLCVNQYLGRNKKMLEISHNFSGDRYKSRFW